MNKNLEAGWALFLTWARVFVHVVVNKTITNLMTGLLAENGRLNKLNGIATAFATLMSAHRGEIECGVTTAKVRRLVHSVFIIQCTNK